MRRKYHPPLMENYNEFALVFYGPLAQKADKNNIPPVAPEEFIEKKDDYQSDVEEDEQKDDHE